MKKYVLRPQYDEHDRLVAIVVEGWKVAREPGDVPQNVVVEIKEQDDGRFIVPGVSRSVKTLLGLWVAG
jgi:hypothetical protein